MPISAEAGALPWLRRVPAMVAMVLVAAVAWHLRGSDSADPPVPQPAGVPVVRLAAAGQPVPVLIVPNRPGRNLVHVAAPQGVSVGTDRGRLATAAARPGASGSWAEVRLPAGPSRLWIARGGHLAALEIDTGAAATTAPGPDGDVTGPDGPECASAVLGRLAAGTTTPVTSCPASALTAADAAALHGTIRFLAQRGQRAISLAADGSPRSVAAAALVRADSAAAGITVGSGGPLVVVAGWAAADRALTARAGDPTRGAAGAYLAPWLLHAPLQEAAIAQLVPLGYSPRDPLPMQYLAALQGRFPDEPASASGYAAWRQARGLGPEDQPRLYAAARLTVPGVPDDHVHGGGWLPHGTITPVTAVLDGTPPAR
ncbi:hypothetical protein Ani05nite_17730 [Amorphoplanes nipponensis]|uniref:Uncharacterized protein n=1 Tax=Actinoplanes nipponensis TaxID=135950 RepID=A0A919JC32_9ACTN|nr:hypothetical protein [Actinoplanes nipponensis]GIE48239.1 hypothetical protein Ani05nite_17730 [Actinoplanes nipponensis]